MTCFVIVGPSSSSSFRCCWCFKLVSEHFHFFATPTPYHLHSDAHCWVMCIIGRERGFEPVATSSYTVFTLYNQLCNRLDELCKWAQPYDTIRDVILTCARKLNLPHEPTTEMCKTEKLKTKKRICSEVTVNRLGIRGVSPEEERKATVGRTYRKLRF